MTSFADRDDFAEIVQESLIDILGESSTHAIIYHLGGATVILYPELFAERLTGIFGAGADVIVRHILKNLKRKNAV